MLMSGHHTKRSLHQASPESCHMPLVHAEQLGGRGHSPRTLFEQLEYLRGHSTASRPGVVRASVPASTTGRSGDLQQLILFHVLSSIRCLGSAGIKWSWVANHQWRSGASSPSACVVPPVKWGKYFLRKNSFCWLRDTRTVNYHCIIKL